MQRPACRPLLLLLLSLLSCLSVASCNGAPSAGRDDLVHLRAENVLGPYSGSVLAGQLCFVSGKIGLRGGTFEEEADSAIGAVREELARSGLTLRDVVSVTVYLTNLDLYHRFNRVYERRFPEPYPSRAVVEVNRLPGGAQVEIQAIARRRR